VKIPELRIGELVFKIPLAQGPMGVQVSSWPLPPAVANEGCLAFITTIALGGPDVGRRDFVRVSKEALVQEIRRCRESTDGPLAVNVMGALSNVYDLIQTAVANGVRIISYGAGIPKNLPELVPDPKVYLIPIISSAKLARFLLSAWLRRYNRAPDAFILEGPLAGGHLGFDEEQLAQPDIFSLEKILVQVLAVVREFEQKLGRKIPVIAAGGIYTGEDIARILHLGASGVQLGTRFVATDECPAADEFKQAYIDAREEDIRIIHSPVGMLGRVIHNRFLDKVDAGSIRIKCPYHCIKSCDMKTAGFCIARALFNAKSGDVDNGLIFAGANVHRIKKILSVKELIAELVEGIRAYPLELPSPA
jgi:nitronate monooxygenase